MDNPREQHEHYHHQGLDGGAKRESSDTAALSRESPSIGSIKRAVSRTTAARWTNAEVPSASRFGDNWSAAENGNSHGDAELHDADPPSTQGENSSDRGPHGGRTGMGETNDGCENGADTAHGDSRGRKENRHDFEASEVVEKAVRLFR